MFPEFTAELVVRKLEAEKYSGIENYNSVSCRSEKISNS